MSIRGSQTSAGAGRAQKALPLKCRVIEHITIGTFETWVTDFFLGTTPHPDTRTAGDEANDILDVQFQHDGTTHRAYIIYAEG